MAFKKPMRPRMKRVKRAPGGPGGGSQPGPRHPPGIQQGPKIARHAKAIRRYRKRGPKPDVITSTKFETITGDQSASVSQYTGNDYSWVKAYDRRQELRNNPGQLTGDYRVTVPPNSNLGRLPDGKPYNPNLAYEFDGKGGYRIVKDYGLGEL